MSGPQFANPVLQAAVVSDMEFDAPEVLDFTVGSSSVDLDETTDNLVRGDIETTVDALVNDIVVDEMEEEAQFEEGANLGFETAPIADDGSDDDDGSDEDDIREGHLDFGLVGLGYEDEDSADPVLQNSLKFEPLFKIPVSIVLRRNHPVTKAKPTAQDLLRYPIACEPPPSSVRRSMIRLAQGAKIPFEGPRLHVDDYNFILRLVARTDFWTALFSDNDEEIEKRKLLGILSIPELVPPMVVSLCYRPNWSMPDAAVMLVLRLQKNAERFRIWISPSCSRNTDSSIRPFKTTNHD